MKRFISIILAVVMVAFCVFAFAGCKRSETANMDIVLITDGSTITDKGYNQSTWDGVKSFGDENNMTYRYYQPTLDDGKLTVETIAKYVELAVNDGAKYIVLPGESFAVSAYEIAPTYKDVQFVLVDALPHSQSDTTLRLQQNVMSISFDVLQAGYLAGYTSVIDGNTKLGYFGSVNSSTSGNYGAGFVQGAALAADQYAIPTTMDYADFDSPILDYDYSFTVTAEYEKIPTDNGVKYYTINVENGLGSGTYADGENVTIIADKPEDGKKFSHWETKSNTDGVSDSKVNISSKKKSTMNLLVEKCDATITAVYEDCETVQVNVSRNPQSSNVEEQYYVPVNSTTTISAPAAESGMVFDHWDCDNKDAIEDIYSKDAKVTVSDSTLLLVPVYVQSKTPTFDIVVENGSGSGSYLAGDKINVVADAPQEGYMFKKWSNADVNGIASGIKMDNEYDYETSFEMVDRYSSIVEEMYDDGAQVVFGGGNAISDSIFSAIKTFDYSVSAFGYGVDEGRKGNCIASVVNDYGAAVKLALADFKGGSILKADCSNGCIYVTGKSINDDEDNYNIDYAKVYSALADGTIKPISVQSGGDVRKAFASSCLTLNYWIVEE